jgi:hypothetical protein
MGAAVLVVLHWLAAGGSSSSNCTLAIAAWVCAPLVTLK